MAKKAVNPTPTKSSTKAPAKGAQPISVPADNDLEKAWGASRVKPPATGGFEVADIPDGDYAVQVQSAKCSAYKSGKKKGTRYFRITYVICAGSYTGTTLSSSDDFSSREVGTTGRTAMDLASARFQKMDIDISHVTLAQMPAMAQAMGDPNSEIGKRYLSVSVKTNTLDGDNGPMTFQNVYVNERLDEAAVKTLQKNLS